MVTQKSPAVVVLALMRTERCCYSHALELLPTRHLTCWAGMLTARFLVAVRHTVHFEFWSRKLSAGGMKRAGQQQAGHMFLRCGLWYVRYRADVVLEDGSFKRLQKCRHLAQAIGPYRTKRSVAQLAEKILRPFNHGEVVAESTMSLNRFIESVYFPYAEQKRRSTYPCEIR